ncbi:MAG: hypothetical protein QNJ42_20420 [Crocosphaera sp.]|nr:hypothetical protein [Crocosphaera sp.]
MSVNFHGFEGYSLFIEKLNAKQSELALSQEEIQRLQSDNARLQKTVDSINDRYYYLVDKLGTVMDDPE